MCGIVGAVCARNIVPILVQGLQRLEYRGYDSCGVAVHQAALRRARSTARVAELEAKVDAERIAGRHRHRPHALGHARRAGVHNAHPHFCHGPRGTREAGEASASPPPGASPWSTTASSRTTTSCAPS